MSVGAGPLDGQTILVTRPSESGSRLSTALEAEGARVIELPTIQIEPPLNWGPLDQAIRRGNYEWVVFASVNAVRFFLERLAVAGFSVAWFSHSNVAAIGSETARSLDAAGVPLALVPDEYIAEALIASLLDFGPILGRRILIPSADIARETLSAGLAAAGAIVDQLTAYRTTLPDPPTNVLAELHSKAVDIVTFTSSSTVKNLTTILGPDIRFLSEAVVACIGPVTAATARELGLDPQIVATTYTIAGLVEAIRRYHLDARDQPGLPVLGAP